MALALLLIVTSCTGTGTPGPAPDDSTTSSRPPATIPDRQTSPNRDVQRDEDTTLVALAKGETLDVWQAPSDDEPPVRTVRAENEASGEIVLVVRQQLASEWVEAHLPVAPPGSTGWVKRDDVTISRHRFRVEIDRSAHELAIYSGDVLALETPVAVGASDAPAPGSKLFIKELIETPDAEGAYGPYTYGLSASSNLAENFEAGSGVVGIHGTADEQSLGQDVPTGSLAVAPDPLNRMVESIGLPLGTPVEILP